MNDFKEKMEKIKKSKRKREKRLKETKPGLKQSKKDMQETKEAKRYKRMKESLFRAEQTTKFPQKSLSDYSFNQNIRYYRGKIKCRIIKHGGKKAIIEYLESGITGPRSSPKAVKQGDKDLVLIRHCFHDKK